MTGPLTDRVGFAHPNRRTPAPQRYAASLELMAGVALVVSTVVAATVVSIGMARADAPSAVPLADHSFAVAVMLGLIFAGWAGLTALIGHGARRHD
jgi:hypothetical protein